jgi:IMP dehydrogenase
LHRSVPAETQAKWVKQVKAKKLLAAAAVGPADLERAKLLQQAGADVLVIDTAHAHNAYAIKHARLIRKAVKAQLIIGNIATKEAAKALASIADALKVGIGPGAICTTRIVAGVGVPQLTAIMDVVSAVKGKGIPVIADGGIKYSGDVVKALAAGASAVMLGSMLAGTDEAPGEVINLNGKRYKSFRGMGSMAVMTKNQSSDRYFQKNAKRIIPEGIEGVTAYKGKVEPIIGQITGGLQSGMGYLGAATIAQMPKQARFIQITASGLRESHPHTVTITKSAPNYAA